MNSFDAEIVAHDQIRNGACANYGDATIDGGMLPLGCSTSWMQRVSYNRVWLQLRDWAFHPRARKYTYTSQILSLFIKDLIKTQLDR